MNKLHLLAAALCVAAVGPLAAQTPPPPSPGDIGFPVKNAGAGSTTQWVTPGSPPRLFGIKPDGTLSTINPGDNITMTAGGVLEVGGFIPSDSISPDISTFLGTPTSANLLAALEDKTGTGLAMFNISPTISSPTITGQMKFGTDVGLKRLSAGYLQVTDGDTGEGNLSLSYLFASSSIATDGNLNAGGDVIMGNSGTYLRSGGGEFNVAIFPDKGGVTRYVPLVENGSGLVNLGTDVTGILPISAGGTGSALTDPNADRVLFWDDSAGAYTHLTMGTGLSITGTTLNATGGGGGSGDVVGPSASDDNEIAVYSGTTGKLIANSGATISGGNLGANSVFANTLGASDGSDDSISISTTAIGLTRNLETVTLAATSATTSWTMFLPSTPADLGDSFLKSNTAGYHSYVVANYSEGVPTMEPAFTTGGSYGIRYWFNPDWPDSPEFGDSYVHLLADKASDEGIEIFLPRKAGRLLLGPNTFGTSGQPLISNGDGTTSWGSAGGDVTGPASSTDNALARFDSTTGKIVQNSNAILTDSGGLTLPGPVVINGGGNALSVTGNVAFDNFASYPYMSVNWPVLGSQVVHDDWQFIWSFNDSYFDGGDVGLGRYGAGHLKVTNGSTGYGNLMAAKVGIGSPVTPDSLLHIKGPVGSEGQMQIEDTGGAGAASTHLIEFRDNVGARIAYIYKEATSNKFAIINEGSGGTFSFGTGASDRLHIDASGNVGINSLSPSARLYVDGNLRTSAEIVSDAYVYGNGFEAYNIPAGWPTAQLAPGILRFIDASGIMSIQKASGAVWALTLPPDDGDAGEAMTTNGSGVTTWESFRPAAKDADAVLSSNFTSTLATATATGLSFTGATGEVWIVTATMTTQCSSTGGVKYSVIAPASSTVEGWARLITTGVTNSNQRLTAINTLTTTATSTAATTPVPAVMQFTITLGGNGTVAIGAASTTAGQTTTIFAGSALTARRVSP